MLHLGRVYKFEDATILHASSNICIHIIVTYIVHIVFLDLCSEKMLADNLVLKKSHVASFGAWQAPHDSQRSKWQCLNCIWAVSRSIPSVLRWKVRRINCTAVSRQGAVDLALHQLHRPEAGTNNVRNDASPTQIPQIISNPTFQELIWINMN